MFGMTATEFVVMSNTDRDALREPWRVSRYSTWSRRATRTTTSTQPNDEVRIMLFDLKMLPMTYLAASGIRAPASPSTRHARR